MSSSNHSRAERGRLYKDQLRDDAARNLLLSVALIAAGLIAGHVHPDSGLVAVGLLLAVGTATFCAGWIPRARFLDFLERNAAAHREEVRAADSPVRRGLRTSRRDDPSRRRLLSGDAPDAQYVRVALARGAGYFEGAVRTMLEVCSALRMVK